MCEDCVDVDVLVDAVVCCVLVYGTSSFNMRKNIKKNALKQQ
jgi:hypothetical protein